MFDLPHYSRYVGVEAINFNGVATFGLYSTPDKIKNLQPRDLISVKIDPGFAGRPDLISQQYYSTPYYCWVIVIYNSPVNPIGWPRGGSTILIPSPSVISEIINGRAS